MQWVTVGRKWTVRAGAEGLKIVAVDAGCDFSGFGLHSFRRANMASKIAGHATVSQTGDNTVDQLKRQEELTRAIQAGGRGQPPRILRRKSRDWRSWKQPDRRPEVLNCCEAW